MSYYRNVSVTKPAKSGPRYSAKLEHSSNYVRFYVAAAPARVRLTMEDRTRRSSFTSTRTHLRYMTLAPFLPMLRNGELSVASGVQRSDVCWFGKMVRVADPMLRKFSREPHENASLPV